MQLDLSILRVAQAMAAHANQRQSLIAENVANANTPGYKARDLASFSKTFNQSDHSFTLRTTRAGHIRASDVSANTSNVIFPVQEQSPNGNNVSLETEMTKSVELRQQYEMALGIYQKSIDILRASLGR
jgi:flagellar basal-body rod protein FlgB